MTTNSYFSQGTTLEQTFYEDLVVESLQFYGQDVWYLPREIVNKDEIFKDDVPSKFENAYQIEMYLENTEGFDGEGDLFTKFGIEIRDVCTFVVARRRWDTVVKPNEESAERPFYRPREGDLIHLPLSNSIFQITLVQDETPFYQLKNLPVFRMTCELFEYNDENFDTGIESIDDVEKAFAYQHVLTLDAVVGDFQVGEVITQALTNNTSMQGEVVNWDSTASKLYLAHIGADDGEYHEFVVNGAQISADVSSATGNITVIEELINTQRTSQNDTFDTIGDSFIDFTESNPFGDTF